MEVTIELAGKNQQWVLNKAEIKMGREAGCDVRLSGDEFAMVSRFHAAVRVEDGDCFVEDANSPNGTFLNGKRVQRAKLFPADTVRLGNDGPELKVRFIPEAAPKVIPPTIAGAGAERQLRSIRGSVVPKESSVAAASERPHELGNAEFVMLERKLDGMRKLLSVTLAVVILLAVIVIYQGYMISRTENTVVQLRRQAVDAVAQFTPALDQKIADFQKRADDMQVVIGGFDGKIQRAEDEFVRRMGKEVPAVMDQYIQNKIEEARGGVKRPPK
jgi:pSer/pThr/pTyr-binding forkhead associated (FHA) protein